MSADFPRKVVRREPACLLANRTREASAPSAKLIEWPPPIDRPSARCIQEPSATVECNTDTVSQTRSLQRCVHLVPPHRSSAQLAGTPAHWSVPRPPIVVCQRAGAGPTKLSPCSPLLVACSPCSACKLNMIRNATLETRGSFGKRVGVQTAWLHSLCRVRAIRLIRPIALSIMPNRGSIWLSSSLDTDDC